MHIALSAPPQCYIPLETSCLWNSQLRPKAGIVCIFVHVRIRRYSMYFSRDIGFLPQNHWVPLCVKCQH